MIKGLTQMFSGEGIPEGYALYAKNIIISNRFNEIINERGNKLLATYSNVAGGSAIVGIYTFGNKIIIWYITNTNENIGVYDESTDTFVVKVTRTDLGLNVNTPIVSAKAKLNSRGQLIVAYTDANTIPKYINLDTALPSDSIDLYNLFLSSVNPNLAGTIIEGGGALKTGCYFATIQYLDRNKSTAQWSPFSDPIYIVLHDTHQLWRETQGTDAGQISSKAIKLRITNLNLNFSKLRVALVSNINGTIESKIYKEVTIHNSGTVDNPFMDVLLTGTEVTTTIGIEEILTPNQRYKTVGELESLADQLFAADLTLEEQTDFQRIANLISLKWTSIPCTNILIQQLLDNLSLTEDGNSQKVFIHDEVYYIAIQFELPNGGLTSWFHIPGRAVSSAHRVAASNNNGVEINGDTPKKYQLEDTCTLEGSVSAAGTETYYFGDMSVWENEDETYPDGFPDFAGENVRHHRFPSMRWLHSNVYNATSGTKAAQSYGRSMWDRLGIRMELTNIPSDLRNMFVGVRLGFAKRDESNTTVLGYDIIQYAANPQLAVGYNTDTHISAGGNWKIQAAGAGDNDVLANKNFVRLHSPDVLFTKPNLTNTYISCQRFMKAAGLDAAYSESTEYGTILHGQSANGIDEIYTVVTNYYRDTGSYTTDDFVVAADQFVKLVNPSYVPANAQISAPDGTITNLFSEECLFAKLFKKVFGKIPSDVDVGPDYTTGPLRTVGDRTSTGLNEQTMLITVKTVKGNLFIGYRDQQIVPFGSIIKIDVDGNIPQSLYRGVGDGFICFHSFLTLAQHANNTTDPAKGVRCIKGFLCESRLNLQQRYITAGDLNTYFYPAAGFNALTNISEYWFTKISLSSSPVNKLVYSTSFNALNSMEAGVYEIFDHEAIQEQNQPFAIARSQKASRETSFDDGWRIFKPNDVFFTSRDKGRIINLCALGTTELLIHHERTLYKTRSNAALKTDVGELTLGSGDIFSIEPEELNPTEYGYGGCQHKFACLLCEAGYAFVDALRGEVLIYTQGNTYSNISKGFTNLFKELELKNIGDNPFKGDGISLSFDSKFYRLLLLIHNDTTQYAFSFDLRKQEWASAHDFKLGTYIFNTRENNYSVYLNNIYTHNIGVRGEYFGVIYPSFVDLVINAEPTKEKILHALYWITEVLNNTGVVKDHETITHVTIWNNSYCTGKIALTSETISIYETSNNKQADRTWRFNAIKDAILSLDEPFIDTITNDYRPINSNIATNLAWFESSPMRGKYFIVRLEYSNIEDKIVSLRSIDASLTPSSR